MSHARSGARRPGRGTARRRVAGRLGVGLALVLVAAACGVGGGSSTSGSADAPTSTAGLPASPACVRNEQDTGCLPLAPEDRRVDLAAPAFSRPTEITNPLLPIAAVTQSLQLGTVDEEPFRAEVTLMPGTKAITWNDRQVPTRIHQYVAYSNGRILEVALDWYARADDGSVWYFGEDVFNYEDGVVADIHGTWLAGKDGPPGMIMPADPGVGDVYRPENIPELVFEQVTVKSTGQRVAGPSGPVAGAVVVGELHLDGATETRPSPPGTASSRPGPAATARRSPWPSRSTPPPGLRRPSSAPWATAPPPASRRPAPGAGPPPRPGSTTSPRPGTEPAAAFPSCWPGS